MAEPIVSIIIVCMDRMDNLRPCLNSIQKWTSLPYETLVIAYMFSEAHLHEAQKEFPTVDFIISNEIRGFAENNNLALKRAKAKFCFVLNDDTEFDGPIIDKLVSDMERLPNNAAIISPRLINPDGSLQLCGRPPYPAINYAKQQWHCYSEPLDDTLGKDALFGEVFQTSNITGAAFLIKTEVFAALGWFDERYFFTPEDIALSSLARQKSYTVYVDRSVNVIHKWKATASHISSAIRPAAVRGSLIFFSSDSNLQYFLLGLAVWSAEFAKRIKACIRFLFRPTEENRIKLLTFRHITRSIFTHRSPKEIFLKYYRHD